MEKITQHINFDFNNLDQNGNIIVEYVWIGGIGQDLRSKARTLNKNIKSVEELPEWNYDGSSCFQANTESSEVILKPVALFKDPFRGGDNKICLCETYHIDGSPTITNFRRFATDIFKQGEKQEPWFGLEQEYTLMQPYGTSLSWPVGWPVGNYPKPQGQYYCAAGSKNVYGREIMNAHYKACLNAGVKIFGINGEVMPGQFEYQIGTCPGIEVGDHMWMSRYILNRVGEYFGIEVTFHPKPVKGQWNGAGCHVNFSTIDTREDVEMQNITAQMNYLNKYHRRMIQLYGEGNSDRLTGKLETSSLEKFSYGVGNRGASVRIPNVTKQVGNGYYEDRRPSANMDPYVVCSALFTITHLDGYKFEELEEAYLKFIEHKKKLPSYITL